MKTTLRVGIAGLGRAGQGGQAGKMAGLPELFKDLIGQACRVSGFGPMRVFTGAQ
ncbi:MAG: hypothetical protein GX174_09955 [Lentisphaerae bacterium]|nr:hypothetical protein [Lentisphaerota bacterium]